jgi:hypothetical protein
MDLGLANIQANDNRNFLQGTGSQFTTALSAASLTLATKPGLPPGITITKTALAGGAVKIQIMYGSTKIGAAFNLRKGQKAARIFDVLGRNYDVTFSQSTAGVLSTSYKDVTKTGPGGTVSLAANPALDSGTTIQIYRAGNNVAAGWHALTPTHYNGLIKPGEVVRLRLVNGAAASAEFKYTWNTVFRPQISVPTKPNPIKMQLAFERTPDGSLKITGKNLSPSQAGTYTLNATPKEWLQKGGHVEVILNDRTRTTYPITTAGIPPRVKLAVNQGYTIRFYSAPNSGHSPNPGGRTILSKIHFPGISTRGTQDAATFVEAGYQTRLGNHIGSLDAANGTLTFRARTVPKGADMRPINELVLMLRGATHFKTSVPLAANEVAAVKQHIIDHYMQTSTKARPQALAAFVALFNQVKATAKPAPALIGKMMHAFADYIGKAGSAHITNGPGGGVERLDDLSTALLSGPPPFPDTPWNDQMWDTWRSPYGTITLDQLRANRLELWTSNAANSPFARELAGGNTALSNAIAAIAGYSPTPAKDDYQANRYWQPERSYPIVGHLLRLKRYNIGSILKSGQDYLNSIPWTQINTKLGNIAERQKIQDAVDCLWLAATYERWFTKPTTIAQAEHALNQWQSKLNQAKSQLTSRR